MISENTMWKTSERLRKRRRNRALHISLAGLVLAVMTGCATPLPAPAPMSSSANVEYKVGAPDQLTVSILPDPIIERAVVVRPDGRISIDLIGDVQAAGRTVEEIAEDVQKQITRFKLGAVVTVAVTRAASSSVSLLGEVNSNRAFALLKQTRVAEAIALSGGVNNFANLGKVRVVRNRGGRTTVIAVDLKAIQKGDLRTNVMLEGGDIIYVPPTIWAKIGHTINAVLYPFQPFLGVGTSMAGTALASAAGI